MGFVEGIGSQLRDRVPAAEWADLVSAGVPVRFLGRQILFHQGEAGRHVFVVQEGTVKVLRLESDGGQALLSVRTSGDVVGDMAVLDQGVRSATVVALGRVHAQMVTAAQFRTFVARPSVAPGFALYTVERLRQSDIQRSELALLPVRTRLARTLLRLAVDSAVDLAQQDLARYVGASRNAVVEELSTLREAGIVSTRRQSIGICDITSLRRVAGL
jgi:CRP/FNR family transcriptional regulator, cyclic AMP receptor protein